MNEDPLLPILTFLAVTGMVLALTSRSGPPAARIRVRILQSACEGRLAPNSAASQPPTQGGWVGPAGLGEASGAVPRRAPASSDCPTRLGDVREPSVPTRHAPDR